MQIKVFIFAVIFIVTSGNEFNAVPDNLRVVNFDDEKVNIDYSIKYGIDSDKTGDVKNLREQRSGDTVKGQYSVNDPDGYIRVVNYTVDKENGFQATVTRVKGTHEFVTREKAQQHRNQHHSKHPSNQQSHAMSMRQIFKRNPNQPHVKRYPKITYDPMAIHKMNQVYPTVTSKYPTTIVQGVSGAVITSENILPKIIYDPNAVHKMKQVYPTVTSKYPTTIVHGVGSPVGGLPSESRYPKVNYDLMVDHNKNHEYATVTSAYPTSIVHSVGGTGITSENLSLLEISPESLHNLYKLGILQPRNPVDTYVTESSLHHSRKPTYGPHRPKRHRKRNNVHKKTHGHVNVYHSYRR